MQAATRRHNPAGRVGGLPVSSAIEPHHNGMTHRSPNLPHGLFHRLSRDYRRRHGVPLVLVDSGGELVFGAACVAGPANPACREARRRAVNEAARWGEPCANFCQGGQCVLWAVPCMDNNRIVGGLVAAGASLEAGSPGITVTPDDVRKACADLLRMADEANVTNSAFLTLQRQRSGHERERAQAIHVIKEHPCHDVWNAYLREEAHILAAIRRGERSAAREIVNRVLVDIYYHGRDRPELLKSLILELVVMMSRAAVESGGDPVALLGRNYESVTRLAAAGNEEEMCHWLTDLLERVMDAIQDQHANSSSARLEQVMHYMEQHAKEPLTRDQAAEAAGMSPSSLSHLLKEKLGRTFTDLLAGYRIDKACDLLLQTDLSLIEIAAHCGFCDQSYFTKVFRKYRGVTPRVFRRMRQAG